MLYSGLMEDDKRDTERVTILGELQAEIMVFEPMLIKDISRSGATVETRFPLSPQLAPRRPAHARQQVRHPEGSSRPLAHQRRRPGYRHLPDGARVRRALRPRRGRHRRVPGYLEDNQEYRCEVDPGCRCKPDSCRCKRSDCLSVRRTYERSELAPTSDSGIAPTIDRRDRTDQRKLPTEAVS